MKSNIYKNKIKTMFKNLYELKKNKMPLCHAIEKSSCNLNLRPESAKNFYYKNLDYLRKNPNIAKNLGIDLNFFTKQKFDVFDEKEEKNLEDFVDENLKKGKSIRKSCFELANGDAKKMLRFQNKYCSLKKPKKVGTKSTNSNIINIKNAKLKMTKKISDSDINALFFGLVKLIKKTAEDSLSQDLKSECEFATHNFRQSLIDLNKKETELKKLADINLELNRKLENQKSQICLLLEKLSKKKLAKLEQKSKEKCSKLKSFKKQETNTL